MKPMSQILSFNEAAVNSPRKEVFVPLITPATSSFNEAAVNSPRKVNFLVAE